jgi:hypothetical protein
MSYETTKGTCPFHLSFQSKIESPRLEEHVAMHVSVPEK